MKILAIDSTAKTASTALMEDNKIISEYFINTSFTHSKTLMNMIDDMLKSTQTLLDDIDLFAVAAGPGSFTGVRIGVSIIKGITMVKNKSCASVSILESMAYNMILKDCIVYSVMDARCEQVYNAVFKINDGNVTRITEDRAISIDDVLKEIKSTYTGTNNEIYFVGDGSDLCFEKYKLNKIENININISPDYLKYQKASMVAEVARRLKKSNYISSENLLPIYLRVPQAQRNLSKTSK